MELHKILKERFPWLGTDEDANGADVIQALSELYNEARLSESEAAPCV